MRTESYGGILERQYSPQEQSHRTHQNGVEYKIGRERNDPVGDRFHAAHVLHPDKLGRYLGKREYYETSMYKQTTNRYHNEPQNGDLGFRQFLPRNVFLE